MRMNIAAVLSAGLFLANTSAAIAQAIPGPADPGRVGERFDTLPQPESQPPIEVPAPKQAPPPEEAERIRFTLRDVTVENATAIDQAVLREAVTPLLGQEVTLRQLYDLRDALTKIYRDAGYVLSQVVLPAQRIQNGAVKLQAVEGFVHEVRFEGAKFEDAAGLLPIFAEKIKASKPLRIGDLERYVLLMNDLAGVEAKTTLKAAPGVLGGAVLTVVLARDPFNAALTLDNRGSESIGPFQIDGSVEVADQVGLFESTRIRLIGSPEIEEMVYLDVTETVPLNTEGTVIQFNAKRTWSEPGGDVRIFELDSDSLALKVGISHPFIRTRAESLRGSLSLTYRDSETLALDDTLSEDRLRIATVGLSYDWADRLGAVNLLVGQFHQGLDILGASDSDDSDLSRDGGRGDFSKLTLAYQRHQPLFAGLSAMVTTEAQYSPHRLLSSEEMGIGGATYGSAYDYSELTGDSGWAGRVELQYTPDLGLPDIPFGQVYVFTDGGTVYNHEDDEDRQGWQGLWSAGLGFRLAVMDFTSISMEVAKPISPLPAATGDNAWRGFFSVTLRY